MFSWIWNSRNSAREWVRTSRVAGWLLSCLLLRTVCLRMSPHHLDRSPPDQFHVNGGPLQTTRKSWSCSHDEIHDWYLTRRTPGVPASLCPLSHLYILLSLVFLGPVELTCVQIDDTLLKVLQTSLYIQQQDMSFPRQKCSVATEKLIICPRSYTSNTFECLPQPVTSRFSRNANAHDEPKSLTPHKASHRKLGLLVHTLSVAKVPWNPVPQTKIYLQHNAWI